MCVLLLFCVLLVCPHTEGKEEIVFGANLASESFLVQISSALKGEIVFCANLVSLVKSDEICTKNNFPLACYLINYSAWIGTKFVWI